MRDLQSRRQMSFSENDAKKAETSSSNATSKFPQKKVLGVKVYSHSTQMQSRSFREITGEHTLPKLTGE